MTWPTSLALTGHDSVTRVTCLPETDHGLLARSLWDEELRNESEERPKENGRQSQSPGEEDKGIKILQT